MCEKEKGEHSQFYSLNKIRKHSVNHKVTVNLKLIIAWSCLKSSQCWRAALEFTTRFLTAHGQGVGQKGQRALHTHKTLQVVHTCLPHIYTRDLCILFHK